MLFCSLYNEFPSATFDSLVHLIHTGMTQQQRTDLLATLVSLDGQSPKSPTASGSSTDAVESIDSKTGDDPIVIKDVIEDR